MRVLVVEDEDAIATAIERGLIKQGYAVDIARDGAEALDKATVNNYDVICLDLTLPRVDGLEVCRRLREDRFAGGIIMLTARSSIKERIEGLDYGADDYLVKPFAFSELLARIEALVRRAKSGNDAQPTTLRVADLEMDLLRRTVHRAGKPIDLQPREFQLLEFLLRHAGQVVTRTMLLEGVWDYHFDPQTNVIDVHISRLRAKIDKGFDRPLLHTVRGAGYRLDV
jgi:two-component system OmpR family response regulator